jgi:peptidoglycan/LPS O-acetylase OafA/YrhL
VTEPILAEPHARHRLKTLDAFRGIAIIAVLLFHYTYRWGPLWPDHRDFYGFAVNHDWFAQGRRGVELFFLVSGFVIFMTLERCADWRDFALRRVARLYPAYLFCMTATFLLVNHFGLEDFHRTTKEYLVGLTMMSDQFGVDWIDGVYWSLLVEIIFYAWIAIIYFNFRRHFLVAWIVFCMATPLIALADWRIGSHFFAAPYLCFFTAGMAFYGVHAQRPLKFNAALFATAFVLYVGFWTKNSLSAHLVVAASVGLFVLFVSGRLNWLGGGVLGFVGLISYPLYLLHQYIGVSLIAAFNATPFLNGWPAVAMAAAIAIALAAAVHYAVELPSQKLVRRNFKRWLAIA